MSVLLHARKEFPVLRVSLLQAPTSGVHRLRALRRELSHVSINASACDDLMYCITFHRPDSARTDLSSRSERIVPTRCRDWEHVAMLDHGQECNDHLFIPIRL